MDKKDQDAAGNGSHDCKKCDFERGVFHTTEYYHL